MCVSTVTQPETKKRRNLRSIRRKTRGRVMPDERVSICGQRPAWRRNGDEGVYVQLGERGADFVGVMTCGSVWVCAVCAHRIAGHRCTEVRRAVKRHCAAGGEVFIVTLTVPHHRHDDLAELRSPQTRNARRTASRKKSPCRTRGPRWTRTAVLERTASRAFGSGGFVWCRSTRIATTRLGCQRGGMI